MNGSDRVETERTAKRTHNPLLNSAAGGRTLSNLQLPLFLLHPPRGFGVLTTTGRKTGLRRRRCIRAIRRGDRVFAVAIKGSRTAWLKNVEATPEVSLRIRGGTFAGAAGRVRDERVLAEAREAYCGTVNPCDFLECAMWISGRPTRAKIEALHRDWFESGTPLAIELVST